MTKCNSAPITKATACSGKCKSGPCKSAPRIWIVAACEGMISLFEKDGADGTIRPKSLNGSTVFASLEQFQQAITAAEQQHSFSQLLIIGSNNDIAWVHSSLAQEAARHIAAEIKYPLLASWFKEPFPLPHLTRALQSILVV